LTIVLGSTVRIIRVSVADHLVDARCESARVWICLPVLFDPDTDTDPDPDSHILTHPHTHTPTKTRKCS